MTNGNGLGTSCVMLQSDLRGIEIEQDQKQNLQNPCYNQTLEGLKL